MDLLSRSKQHAYCVARTFLSARAALHAYYIFISCDVNNSAIWLALPTFRQSTRKVCVIP